MGDRSGLGDTGKIELVSANLSEINFANNDVRDLPGSKLDIATSALKGQMASGDVSANGVSYRAIAVPMTVMGTAWAVMAEQTYEELLAPSNQLDDELAHCWLHLPDHHGRFRGLLRSLVSRAIAESSMLA